MLWNFVLILLLVGLNGFFVTTEFAVITARKTLETNFNDPNYDTTAGYLLGHLDQIPVQGETIMLAGEVQLQVTAMDGLRISRVQIRGV